MSRCPDCFNPLPDTESAWRCSHPACRQHVKPRSPVDDPAGDRSVRLPAAVESLGCPECGNRCVEVCRAEVFRGGERVTCGYRLPRDWRSAHAVCVVMAGARSTGKSIYIAVVVKQLAQLARLGMTVTPADDATARNYHEHYEAPLYIERNIISATGSARVEDSHIHAPLVYSVRAPHGGHWFLAIRDVAGEDLEPGRPLDAAQLSFFARADGVMFLFDPLAVRAVRDSLSDAVEAKVSGADPAQVLERTLDLMGGRGRLAVVLSKFDAIQELGLVERSPLRSMMQNPGAACMRDPGPLAAYDEGDAQLLHEEVRSLLNKLGAEALVGRLQWAGIEHRFFAVSALGEAPFGQALHGRGIAPFRCLDPVKWFLGAGAV